MMHDDHKRYKIIILTILTITVIILTTMVGLHYYDYKDGEGPGYFYTRGDNRVVYRGEIVPEEVRSRTQKADLLSKTTIQFYESQYNFGNVTEGTVLKHAFRFKNTGNHPLMITKTDVTCGCTVPEFPVDPITPGSDGEVVVVFNTTGKSGVQKKEITIHANTLPETVSIGIEADVR
jgi:Protein of unknown function (DUF1573)